MKSISKCFKLIFVYNIMHINVILFHEKLFHYCVHIHFSGNFFGFEIKKYKVCNNIYPVIKYGNPFILYFLKNVMMKMNVKI